MNKVNMIEVIQENCTGCRLCEMACSFFHEKECSTTMSRIKILQGREWSFDCPLLCIQCPEAPCIESCSVNALHRDEKTGVMLVDDEACIGCGDCIDSCPLHALSSNKRGIIFKCDLCGGDPECVKWCTRGALIFKEIDLDSPSRQAYMDKAIKFLAAVI